MLKKVRFVNIPDSLMKEAKHVNMTKLLARRKTTGPLIGRVKSSNVVLGFGKPLGKPAIVDTKTADSGLEAPRNSLEIIAETSELWRKKESTGCYDIPFAVEYPLLTHALRETPPNDTPPVSRIRTHNFPSRHKSPGVIARLMGLDTLPEVSKPPIRSPVEPCVREVEGHHVSPVHRKSSNGQEMEDLSFRVHPQEKQLQEFKKTFEAQQQAFQVRARLHPLEAPDVKWLEARTAELNKPKHYFPDTFYFLQSNKHSSVLRLLEESQIPYSKPRSNYPLDEGKTLSMKLMGKAHYEKGNNMLEIKRKNYTAGQLIESKSSREVKLSLERQTAAKARLDRHVDSLKLASTNIQATACPQNYQKQSFALHAAIEHKDKRSSSSSSTKVLVLKPDPSSHHLKRVSSPRFSCTTGADEISEMRCGGYSVDDAYDRRLDSVKLSKRASKTKTMAAEKEPGVIAREIAPHIRDAVTRELSKSSPSRIDSIPQGCNVKTFELAGLNNDARTSPSTQKFVKEAPSRASVSLPCSPRHSELAEDKRKDIKAPLSEKSKLGAPTRSEMHDKKFPAQGKKLISDSILNSRTKNVVKRLDDLKRERFIEDSKLSSRSSKTFSREIDDCQTEEKRVANSPITLTRSRSLPSSSTKCTESLHDNKLHTKASSRMADWPCTISDTKTSKTGTGLSLKKEASGTSSKGNLAGMRFRMSMSKVTVRKEATYQNQQTLHDDKTLLQNKIADCFEPLADNCSKFEAPSGKCLANSVDSGICFTNSVNESCSTANLSRNLTNPIKCLKELVRNSTQSERSLNAEHSYLNYGKKIDQNDDSLNPEFNREPGNLSLNDSCDAPESGIEKFEQHSPVSVLEPPFFEKVERSIPELQELCLRFDLLKLDEDEMLEPNLGTVLINDSTPIIECKDSTNAVPNCHTADTQEKAPSCLNIHHELSDQGKIWMDKVPCPPGKEKHMEYVQKIIHSRGFLIFPEVLIKSWSLSHPHDQIVSGKTGDQQYRGLESYFQQLDQNVPREHAQTTINQSIHSSEHGNLNISDQRLLADVVDESIVQKLMSQSSSWIWPKTLAITSRSAQTGIKLLQDTCAEVCSCLYLSCLDSQENLYRLSNFDLEKRSGWIEVDEEVAKICQQLEQHILKDLIKETVSNLLLTRGSITLGLPKWQKCTRLLF